MRVGRNVIWKWHLALSGLGFQHTRDIFFNKLKANTYGLKKKKKGGITASRYVELRADEQISILRRIKENKKQAICIQSTVVYW